MSDRLEIDISPSERVAIVTLRLARGESLTPADVARDTECTVRNGYYVLERLSRVIPLCEDRGRWSLVRDGFILNIE